MICTLFVLTQKPELADRLREELRPHVPEDPDEMIMDDKIMNLDLLNGIVQEALRLYPPSPSHPTRITPPEGAVIAGRFIPGDTQVMAPQYIIGRGKRAFFPQITSQDTDSNTNPLRRTHLSPGDRVHPRALVQPPGFGHRQERHCAILPRAHELRGKAACIGQHSSHCCIVCHAVQPQLPYNSCRS